MITVPVHKDVYSYEPKVLWMLTQRTLVFSAVGAAAGLAIGAALTLGLHLPTNVMMYAVLIITLPIWYFGFARPCKMKPEALAPFWLRHTFLTQEVVYASSPVINNTCDPSMFGSDVAKERYNKDAQPPIQPHYAKLRRADGIEAYDPGESLGL